MQLVSDACMTKKRRKEKERKKSPAAACTDCLGRRNIPLFPACSACRTCRRPPQCRPLPMLQLTQWTRNRTNALFSACEISDMGNWACGAIASWAKKMRCRSQFGKTKKKTTGPSLHGKSRGGPLQNSAPQYGYIYGREDTEKALKKRFVRFHVGDT